LFAQLWAPREFPNGLLTSFGLFKGSALKQIFRESLPAYLGSGGADELEKGAGSKNAQVGFAGVFRSLKLLAGKALAGKAILDARQSLLIMSLY
jgi:hypothetical protein